MSGEAERIHPSRWGKDHWSTLAYIETRIVDHAGEPDWNHLRCDWSLHPYRHDGGDAKDCPTRLLNGATASPHDDWSCIEDAEAFGLLEWCGTGANPVFVLTTLGALVCGRLRAHKARGGTFATFDLCAETDDAGVPLSKRLDDPTPPRATPATTEDA